VFREPTLFDRNVLYEEKATIGPLYKMKNLLAEQEYSAIYLRGYICQEDVELQAAQLSQTKNMAAFCSQNSSTN
jgi:hypothetical protein